MPPTESRPEPTRVLVVDDEEGIRRALERFLTRVGYGVIMAEDARLALQQIAAQHPQAMVCDVRMPQMSGVDLVPQALAADSDLAIIMLTAIDVPRTAIDCLKLGAYDYLIKPVDLEELELALQSALRRRQLEIDRRGLEQWLAREVAVRTHDLEGRVAAIESIVLDLLAGTADGPAVDAALTQLARELGVSRDDVVAEVKRRRA